MQVLATLAAEIIEERLRIRGLNVRSRIDLIGGVSIFDSDDSFLRQKADLSLHSDLRLRLAVEADNRETVEQATQEVLALLCCGPAGGAGVRRNHVERINTVSFLVPKSSIQAKVTFA